MLDTILTIVAIIGLLSLSFGIVVGAVVMLLEFKKLD